MPLSVRLRARREVAGEVGLASVLCLEKGGAAAAWTVSPNATETRPGLASHA